jgi:AcrR family transcriptional regulator
MPKRARKPYHHGDLREQLVAAGELALAELPVADVTLREIARRAGVSHAAPRHHFPTLGHLLAEIAARGFERFVADLADAADQVEGEGDAARLAAMSDRYIRFAAENPAVYGLMFGKSGQCVRTPHLAEAAGAAWQQLVGGVTPLVGASRATAAATLVFSTVHGYSMLRLEGRHPPELAGAATRDSMLQMMMNGLAAADD